MSRRPNTPLVRIAVALTAMAACTDSPVPTEPPPANVRPTAPAASAGPVAVGVRYVNDFDFVTIVENAFIIPGGDEGAMFGPNVAEMEGGVEFTVGGNYRSANGPAAVSCGSPCADLRINIGWLEPDDGRFPEYIRAISGPTQSVARASNFTWTTRTPSTPGTYRIGFGHAHDFSPVRNVILGYDLVSPALTPNVASYEITVPDPVVIPTVTGNLGDNGWYRSGDVTVSWDIHTLGEIESKRDCDTRTISADTPGELIVCTVVLDDGASKQKPVTVKRDATRPSASFITLTPNVGVFGWANTAVRADWTCSDALSGPQQAAPSILLSTEGANQSVTNNCKDNAGNTNSFAVTTRVNIDLTPPTLAPTLPAATFELNAVASATPNAADALSGLASASCDPVATNVAGSFTVNCTAIDKAGNGATKSVSYTVKSPYNFGGFQPPIGANSTLNSATAGSAVPVKFSVGGYKGLNILAAGSPSSKSLACPASSAVNTIVAAAAKPTTGASLTYDAKTDTYTYTWKTEKSWAGTCRTLVVKLNDGLEHTADFRFTK